MQYGSAKQTNFFLLWQTQGKMICSRSSSLAGLQGDAPLPRALGVSHQILLLQLAVSPPAKQPIEAGMLSLAASLFQAGIESVQPLP